MMRCLSRDAARKYGFGKGMMNVKGKKEVTHM